MVCMGLSWVKMTLQFPRYAPAATLNPTPPWDGTSIQTGYWNNKFHLHAELAMMVSLISLRRNQTDHSVVRWYVAADVPRLPSSTVQSHYMQHVLRRQRLPRLATTTYPLMLRCNSCSVAKGCVIRGKTTPAGYQDLGNRGLARVC
jgi:hypothetical protein